MISQALDGFVSNKIAPEALPQLDYTVETIHFSQA
jgi:hypothetical protein